MPNHIMVNLHNSMWLGIVGKRADAVEPVISLECMIAVMADGEGVTPLFIRCERNIICEV